MSYTTPYISNRCGRDRLLEATQTGMLDPQDVIEMVARWLTSDEIRDTILDMLNAKNIYTVSRKIVERLPTYE